MRVHELARLLKKDARELVQISKDLGLPVNNTMSKLEDESVEAIKKYIAEQNNRPKKQKEESTPKVDIKKVEQKIQKESKKESTESKKESKKENKAEAETQSKTKTTPSEKAEVKASVPEEKQPEKPKPKRESYDLSSMKKKRENYKLNKDTDNKNRSRKDFGDKKYQRKTDGKKFTSDRGSSPFKADKDFDEKKNFKKKNYKKKNNEESLSAVSKISKDKESIENSKRKSYNKRKRYEDKFFNDAEGGKLIKRDLTKKTGNTVSKQKLANKKETKDEAPKVYKINPPITVKEFAEKVEMSTSEIITELIKLGVMAGINESLDRDVLEVLALESGLQLEFAEPEKEVDITEMFGLNVEDDEKDLVKRAPVVTVMGHVDHGKTSLLDAIRQSKITANEAGGITQHIGAYTVRTHSNKITFLDTPGHEAFTMMRSRGAQITDVAVLVVAADDGVMPQTIEAISHAKAAGVPIIVAINKIDKPSANIERVKQELTEHELVPEEWGGETVMVPVSAKTKEGIDELLDMIILVSDMQDLKANPNRKAVGIVIDAKLDIGRGPVASILVNTGTLKVGDNVATGTSNGRIRNMLNDKGKNVKKAGPSVPVEIQGLSEVPNAGDYLYVFDDEKIARSYSEEIRQRQRNAELKSANKISLNDIFERIKEGNLKELNIVLKGDVDGSVEAVTQSLLKLSTDEVKIKIIHSAVGAISESDVNLATSSDAIIIGFNVRPNNNALEIAKLEGIDIRTYTIIYKLIEDVEAAVKGMHAPKYQEKFLGRAEIRETFKLPSGTIIAGSYVSTGKITRNSKVKILRDNIIIFEGEVESLRRFKDDVSEVTAGYECGIGINGFNDIRVGDVIEASIMEEIEI